MSNLFFRHPKQNIQGRFQPKEAKKYHNTLRSNFLLRGRIFINDLPNSTNRLHESRGPLRHAYHHHRISFRYFVFAIRNFSWNEKIRNGKCFPVKIQCCQLWFLHQIAFKWRKNSWRHTVWIFQDFSIIQILLMWNQFWRI